MSLQRGLAAGLLAGLFALLVGEVVLEQAVAIERAAVADQAHVAPPLVDRAVQRALVPVSTAIVGSAIGGMFGVAWMGLRPRMRESSDWRASLKLGGCAWATVALFPGLVHPATPPAAGAAGTIGARATWFVTTIGAGVTAALVLWRWARSLDRRGWRVLARRGAVVAATVLLFAALYVLLPAGRETVGVPAPLVWDFRVATFATQLLLWSAITVGFGLLTHRAAQRGQAHGKEA
ncbi:MAG: hypothetical protein GEU81_03470 [Nitriliruptorales bacterium]|nr:hypothetical protein [Nitriliruptorales bacterium]